jgi:hypothetical protein
MRAPLLFLGWSFDCQKSNRHLDGNVNGRITLCCLASAAAAAAARGFSLRVAADPPSVLLAGSAPDPSTTWPPSWLEDFEQMDPIMVLEAGGEGTMQVQEATWRRQSAAQADSHEGVQRLTCPDLLSLAHCRCWQTDRHRHAYECPQNGKGCYGRGSRSLITTFQIHGSPSCGRIVRLGFTVASRGPPWLTQNRTANVRRYTYGSLVVGSFAISQHFAAVFIFLAVFVRLHACILDPRLLVWISIGAFIFGYAVWEILDFCTAHRTRKSLNESRAYVRPG